MGKSRIVLALLAGALVGAPAAAQAQPVQPVAARSGQPAVAASLVIEQFLRAVNANDLETMARLFGTEKGSVWERDPRPATEQRMFALASILRHEDYRIEGAEIVPGRGEAVTRVQVRMVVRKGSAGVPFTLIRHRDNWLIEQIGIEEVTSRR
jgi:hypothetical protein